jgi:hypothetical protein
MAEAVLTIIVLSVASSLMAPALMLLLARFGYFDPIEFQLFGKTWR